VELGVPVDWDNTDATAEYAEINPGPGTGGDGCLAQDGWCNDAEFTGEPAI
jgi:hypothetical protein